MRLFSALLCAALAFGCDGDDTPDGGPGLTDAGPPEGYDAGSGPRIPEAEAAAGREACRFGRGAMPWETVGEELPIGDDIPIDHLVVVMQENRSFDHYFGAMPEVDGIPAGASNPDTGGAPVEAFHTSAYCIVDVSHNWTNTHAQVNGGAMDGFVTTNNPQGARAMGFLDQTDLPFYYGLAQTFAMSDHHHCSLQAGTWTNRMYMLSGTSFGLVSNQAVPTERVPDEGDHVVWEQLERAGVSWAIYAEQVQWAVGGYPHSILRGRNRSHLKTMPDFFAALDTGELEEVVFLDPLWADTIPNEVDGTDEHPPANPQLGQEWVAEIVNRVIMSDLWANTAIVITYDEHGGFYDHVAPPEACPPGDFPSGRPEGEFDELGIRVPLIVVSPYSRPGHVSDRVTDLSSILRLVQTRHLLPALSGRDANAWPMLDMFDFTSPPRLSPPALPTPVVDAARLAECHRQFGE